MRNGEPCIRNNPDKPSDFAFPDNANWAWDVSSGEPQNGFMLPMEKEDDS